MSAEQRNRVKHFNIRQEQDLRRVLFIYLFIIGFPIDMELVKSTRSVWKV